MVLLSAARTGDDLIVIGGVPWTDDRSDPGIMLARAFAPTGIVLYVEPPAVHFPFGSSRRRPGIRRATDYGALEAAYILTPPRRLPLLPSVPLVGPALNAWSTCRTARAVARAARRLGLSCPVLLSTGPPLAAVQRALVRAHRAPRATVLYRTAPLPNPLPEAHPVRTAARSVDAVLAPCIRHLNPPALRAPSVHGVSLGIDFSLYHRGAEHFPPGETPCIGCLGPVDASVDTALIRDLCTALPEHEVLFIGPIHDEDVARALDALPVVTLLGNRAAKEHPLWLRMLDVGLVPLRSDAAAEDAARRLLTFFAAGLPVAVPSAFYTEPATGLAVPFSHRRRAARAIRRALRTHTPRLARARIERARPYDWSHRASDLQSLLRLYHPERVGSGE